LRADLYFCGAQRAVVIGLIIGLRITADQQRPEQTGRRRCETIWTGETDNSLEKMQNVRADSSAREQQRKHMWRHRPCTKTRAFSKRIHLTLRAL
jgi:hypothetical protein